MEFTLLILAGGLGTRFNGKKQIHGVGPNGELLLEYSIYDAIQEGCTKIVILTIQECIPQLKLKLNYLKSKVDIHFVDQYKFDPNYPNYRKRPWGTGHAVLSCEDYIDDLFMIINADDFYGKSAYSNSVILMKELKGKEYGLVAYRLGNTLSNNGGVSRGLCNTEKEQLISISECTNIEMVNGKLSCNDELIELDVNQMVSMNLWLFRPTIFLELEKAFKDFYNRNKNKESAELFLPAVINNLIQNHKHIIKLVSTNSLWFGLTYSTDLVPSQEKLKSLIDNGDYPSKFNV